MDKFCLKGGQNWDHAVKEALNSASLVICFFSANSVSKRGYIQREIKISLDALQDKLDGDIFFIPVILDDEVGIPDQISHIHAIRGDFLENARSLLDSIHFQFKALGISSDIEDGPEEVSCATEKFEEEWGGFPGYAVALDLIRLNSAKYPQLNEATSIVNGWLFEALHSERSTKFHQSPNEAFYSESEHSRTNLWEASLARTELTGTSLSIIYEVFWYGAGAAHPNHLFNTFCFALNPMIHIKSLSDIFLDSEKALAKLQAIVRHHFLHEHERSSEFTENWVTGGTEKWDDFSSFAFQKNGIEVLFAPYSINCYAAGSHSIVVPYEKIVDDLDHNFRHILGVAYIDRKALSPA